jgi:hypothetical protein
MFGAGEMVATVLALGAPTCTFLDNHAEMLWHAKIFLKARLDSWLRRGSAAAVATAVGQTARDVSFRKRCVADGS